MVNLRRAWHAVWLLSLVSPAGRAQESPSSEEVARLVRALRSDKPEVRHAAAGELATLREVAEPAVPSLVQALTSGADPTLKDLAGSALACIGSPAVPEVVKLLHHDDESIRRAALDVFAMSPAGHEALPELLNLLDQVDDRAYEPRDHVIFAITEIAPRALPALIARLERGDHVGYNVEGVFSHVGKAAVPGLVAALCSPDRTTREWAARALKAVGPNALLAIDDIVATLDDEDFGDRTKLVEAIQQLGSSAKLAVPPLLRLLNAPAEVPRATIFRALGSIGTSARAAVPRLESYLDGDPAPDRIQAALALWQITGKAERTLAMCSPLLEQGDRAGTRAVLRALSAMGPDAVRLAPLVARQLRTLADSDAALASQALSAMGPRGMPAILDLLRRSPAEHACALSVLSSWGAEAVEALPHVVKLLGSTDADLRRRALRTIAAMGGAAEPALPDVIPLLHDEETAEQAALVLTTVPGPADLLLPELRRLLTHGNDRIVFRAIEAVHLQGPHAAPLVPVLIDGCESGRMLWDGLEALGQIGPGAARAVPLLRRYSRHPLPGVRVCVALALWRILGDDRELDPAVATLDCPIWATRAATARELGALGVAPDCAVRPLMRLLHDPDWRVQLAAAEALGRLSARQAMAPLRGVCADPNADERVRAAASAALRLMS